MKRLLYVLMTISVATAIDSDPSPLNSMTSLTDAINDIGYTTDQEYTMHQEVHKQFFGRSTTNKSARKAIELFKSERPGNLSRINLDGYSSRTRILMMKELIESAKGKAISIPMQFHKKDFDLTLKPTPDQPGNGILSNIGKYKDDIHPVVSIYTEESQGIFSEKMASVRKTPKGHQPGTLDYHPVMKHRTYETLNLEMLNLLLDFEVARRLIDRPKNEYGVRFDSVPVGSAIVELLRLSQLDETDPGFVPLEYFFDGKNTTIASTIFRYGKYNPFEGSAGNPRYNNNPNHREQAVKNILRKSRKKATTKHVTKESIHQSNLEVFGGASESEGESYDKPIVTKKRSSSKKK